MMKRKITISEKAFMIGLILILLFMLIHDWVPLGALNDVEAIKSQQTTSELLQITALNTLSILIVMVLAMAFIGKRYPIWAKLWLVIHLGFIAAGVIIAWWIPYFFGADQETIDRYDAMFGNTHAFLPEMNHITPNTIHVFFHLVLLVTWILAIYISIKKVEV